MSGSLGTGILPICLYQDGVVPLVQKLSTSLASQAYCEAGAIRQALLLLKPRLIVLNTIRNTCYHVKVERKGTRLK